MLNVFNYDIKKSVELQFEVDKGLFIEGYDIKLFQLWSNIIKNALESLDQFRERGILKIDALAEGDYVTVSISNNGPAIPEEIRTRIFEKFFTTKARKNGSGLGLSIVRSVLDEHNASISLASNEHWTSFSIKFKLLNFTTQKNEVEIELM